MEIKNQVIKNLLLIRSQMYLYQVEEYVIPKFLGVVLKKPFAINVEKVKKLVWTIKATLVLSISLIIYSLLTLTFLLSKFSIIICIIPTIILAFFPWIYIVIADFIHRPRDIFNRWYVKYLTRKKLFELKQKGLIEIGITGSYGKTSTKVFISEILNKKFKTLATPKSYNTLFGIAQAKWRFGNVKSVLEYLSDELKYFIVEMGAYKIGEIEELVYAYPPDIAVLTGLTTMHFEKFGSLENTIQAKGELIQGLPDGKKLFINISNEHLAKVATLETEKGRVKVFTYGFEEKADFSCKVIGMTDKGSVFDVKYSGNTLKFNTSIIGLGNILNLTGAVAVGLSEGVAKEDIINSVKEMKQLDARMQIIDNGYGLTIINNGFSSNPESFKQSLDTLRLFESQFKVFVTPGIFELGVITENVHKELGMKIPHDIDLVMIVGKDKENPRIHGLKMGLETSGFPQDKIVYIDNTVDFFNQISKRNLIPAVVLFENDVPDIQNL